MFAVTFLGYTLGALWVTLVVVAWIAIALWPAIIARSKGHSFWGWFVLSLFFWWITLIAVLFIDDRHNPRMAPIH